MDALLRMQMETEVLKQSAEKERIKAEIMRQESFKMEMELMSMKKSQCSGFVL
jgi:hypothetical protein